MRKIDQDHIEIFKGFILGAIFGGACWSLLLFLF
jgi:hypothetical protein